MRIQHNISAINAHRQFGNNNNAVSGNLEKLSSGYRINKAGDDAAGLAISEKMRAQIKGLDTAQKNAQDGISLVQTAEGALTEVHSMLNRMTELATQSANGTYQDATDRDNLQKEIDSLRTEINRIADGTNYNGIKLLDGTQSGGGAAGANAGKVVGQSDVVADIAAKAAKFTLAAATGGVVAAGKTGSVDIAYTDADGNDKNINILIKPGANTDPIEYSLDGGATWESSGVAAAAGATAPGSLGQTLTKVLAKTELGDMFNITDGTGGAVEFVAKEAGATKASVKSAKIVVNKDDPTTSEAVNAATNTPGSDAFQTLELKDAQFAMYDGTNAKNAIFEINGQKFAMVAKGKEDKAGDLGDDVNWIVGTNAASGSLSNADSQALASLIAQKTGLDVTIGKKDGTVSGTAADNTAIHIKGAASGGAGGAGGGLTLQIGDTSDPFNQVSVSIDDMHADSLGIGKIDISKQGGAKDAIDNIKKAIDKVSSTRGDLGALQNRLDHTINNLGVASENMSAAESRIRDVDMAKEMMDFTKNNILTQASQAMLAQANQLPQGVLQLLQ